MSKKIVAANMTYAELKKELVPGRWVVKEPVKKFSEHVKAQNAWNEIRTKGIVK